MPVDAFENRIADVFLTVLGGIGTPASSWLSGVPLVIEGSPAEAVPEPSAVHALSKKGILYLEHVRTGPAPGEVGTSTHTLRATFCITILAETVRDLRKLKADVLRALWAAEGTFTTAEEQPAFTEDFTTRDYQGDSLRVAGYFGGTLSAFVESTLTHAKP